MVGTPEEQKSGMKWFFGGLLAAVALTAFLFTVDNRLSNSDREKRLGKELNRLRVAQATVGTGVVDPRAGFRSEGPNHAQAVESDSHVADAAAHH